MSPSKHQDKKDRENSVQPTTSAPRNHEKELDGLVQQIPSGSALQRVTAVPTTAMRPQDVLTLQRSIGNQAVQRLIQTKHAADHSVSGQTRPGLNTIQRMKITAGSYELDSGKLDVFKRKIDSIKETESQTVAMELLEKIATKLREEGEESDDGALRYAEQALQSVQMGETEVELLQPLNGYSQTHSTSSISNNNNDTEKAYAVRESKSQWLKEGELQHGVIAPGVSGCAAIKVNVFSKESEKAEETLVASVVFHSDGKQESKNEATSIGIGIVQLSCPNKRVRILVMNNEHANSLGEDHREVLEELEKVLNKEKIKFEKTFMSLKRKTKEVMDIDLTGAEEEIRERYEANLGFTEEEVVLKRKLYTEYKELSVQAEKLGIFNMYVKGGIKGTSKKKNPNYVKKLTPSEWSKLEPKEALKVVNTLRGKVEEANSSSCVIS